MNLIIRPISFQNGFSFKVHSKRTKLNCNKPLRVQGKKVLNSVETSEHSLMHLAEEIWERFHETNQFKSNSPIELAESLRSELGTLINQLIQQLEGQRQACDAGICDDPVLLEGASIASKSLFSLYGLLTKHEYPIDSLSPTQRKYLKKYEKSPSQSGN